VKAVGPIPVLHLVNEVADCSISHIIERIVTSTDPHSYSWHIGGVNELGSMVQAFRDHGVHVVDFSAKDGSKRGHRREMIRRIRQYVRTHQIAVVHSHTLRTRMLAAAALRGAKETSHVDTVHHFYHATDRPRGGLYAVVDRVTLLFPSHLVAVSQRMYREIVALPFVNARRLTAIQNAIDSDAFYKPELRESCRAEFGIAADAPVIGYTGQLLGLKRLDLLLESFAHVLALHPTARLMIVGAGEERPALERLAETLGVAGSVVWAGFRDDIPRLLSAFDVFVLPSSNEGLSLSLLEAMAAGKAVVVTDVGGAREVVSDQETALLIQPGSLPELREAICGLLSDPAKRARMGEAARESVCRNFNVKGMARAYDDIYQRSVFCGRMVLNAQQDV
jgi:glycosyltransferase involved in cell wall biosynthesis